MAKNDGIMPNGRNELGGRKPAIPSTFTRKGYGKLPAAGLPENADLSGGKKTPSPTRDLEKSPSIPKTAGTHMGSTADLSSDWHPVKRRTLKGEAK